MILMIFLSPHLTRAQEIPALVPVILVTAAQPLPVAEQEKEDDAKDDEDQGGDGDGRDDGGQVALIEERGLQ